jgi:hypothetical protein
LKDREKTDSAFALTTYGTNKLVELRRIPTEDIIRPIINAHPAPRFGPVVDGYFFPKSVAEIYAAGEQAHIPLLAGWNADEGRGSLVGGNNRFTAEGFVAQAETEFPGRAEQFLKLYPASNQEQAFQSASDFAGDKFIAFSTWSWLDAQVATGHAPVYRSLSAILGTASIPRPTEPSIRMISSMSSVRSTGVRKQFGVRKTANFPTNFRLTGVTLHAPVIRMGLVFLTGLFMVLTSGRSCTLTKSQSQSRT